MISCQIVLRSPSTACLILKDNEICQEITRVEISSEASTLLELELESVLKSIELVSENKGTSLFREILINHPFILQLLYMGRLPPLYEPLVLRVREALEPHCDTLSLVHM